MNNENVEQPTLTERVKFRVGVTQEQFTVEIDTVLAHSLELTLEKAKSPTPKVYGHVCGHFDHDFLRSFDTMDNDRKRKMIKAQETIELQSVARTASLNDLGLSELSAPEKAKLAQRNGQIARIKAAFPKDEQKQAEIIALL